MTKLWRTKLAISAAPEPAAFTGKTDLLEHFGLSQIVPFAAKALNIDYTNPEHKQFDYLSRLQVPDAQKQLYRNAGPIGACPWDLQSIPSTFKGQTELGQFSLDWITQRLQLQPGHTKLPEAALGVKVGPDRAALATLASQQPQQQQQRQPQPVPNQAARPAAGRGPGGRPGRPQAATPPPQQQQPYQQHAITQQTHHHQAPHSGGLQSQPMQPSYPFQQQYSSGGAPAQVPHTGQPGQTKVKLQIGKKRQAPAASGASGDTMETYDSGRSQRMRTG